MFERIIVPLDGSDLAESVLPLACALGRAYGAELILLRSTQTNPPLDPGLEAADHARTAVEAAEYLARVRKYVGIPGLRISTVVPFGAAAEMIAGEARERRADLIVMATHGRHGLARWAFGSISDQVLHAFAGYLLVVRPCRDGSSSGPTGKLKSIVIPLDGSDLAESALQTGADLASRLGTPVALVQVLSAPERITAENDDALAHADDRLEPRRAAAEQYLASVAATLSDHGLAASWQVRVGNVAEQIAAAANEVPGSLVVMGTHGRSGFDRWLHGSVADEVVRTAGVPVLLRRGSLPRAGEPQTDNRELRPRRAAGPSESTPSRPGAL